MLVSLLDAWYWLALAGWFACVLSSAIIPPVVFRVIQEADPTLPRVLSVNLDNQHSTLLAGDVVRGILSVFFGLQIVCCATFLPALITKWFLIDLSGQRIVFPIMISALYLFATAFMIYGRWVVWPKVLKHRTNYLEQADNPDIANAELDLFDRYSGQLYSVVRNLLFATIGMLIFSAALRPVSIPLI